MRIAVSPTFLESVANLPRVRPYIGPGTHRFEAGESWARTVALEWAEGGVVFLRESPRVYSAHLVFAPKTPDPAGKLRAALGYLFTTTDCLRVIGETPARYRHVRKTAERAGLKHINDESGASHYALTRSQWLTDEE